MLLLLRSLLDVRAVAPPVVEQAAATFSDDDDYSSLVRAKSTADSNHQIIFNMLMSIVASGVLEE